MSASNVITGISYSQAPSTKRFVFPVQVLPTALLPRTILSVVPVWKCRIYGKALENVISGTNSQNRPLGIPIIYSMFLSLRLTFM